MAYWGNDPLWQRLTGPQRAAAMALLEARVGTGGIDVGNARNALGAIINRAEDEGQSLSAHASRSIYQPIIEDAQRARLPQILNSPEFKELSELAQRRARGEVQDWVGGADHYLAPPPTMVGLYEKDPDKYHNWGPFKNSKGIPGTNWSGYDPETGQYKDVVLKDNSHHFLNLIGDKAAPPSNQPALTSNAPMNREDRTVLPFLSELFSAGGASPAMAGTSSAASIDPEQMDGLLAPLFGGTFSPQDQGGTSAQSNGGGGLTLAQSAQQRANTPTAPLQPLQPKSINLQQLQTLMANRPMLSMRGFS